MAAYPEFEKLLEKIDQNRLLEVRRSPLSLLSLITVFIISAVAVYGATGFVSESKGLQEIHQRGAPTVCGHHPIFYCCSKSCAVITTIYIYSARTD